MVLSYRRIESQFCSTSEKYIKRQLDTNKNIYPPNKFSVTIALYLYHY